MLLDMPDKNTILEYWFKKPNASLKMIFFKAIVTIKMCLDNFCSDLIKISFNVHLKVCWILLLWLAKFFKGHTSNDQELCKKNLSTSRPNLVLLARLNFFFRDKFFAKIFSTRQHILFDFLHVKVCFLVKKGDKKILLWDLFTQSD